MRIITLTCQNCGTVVAENVLERNRVMNCPRHGCAGELRFDGLDEADRTYVEENLERFRMEP